MTGAVRVSRLGESEEPVMDRNDLRIGDAEREQTMAALREHFAQGRLTHEELDERLDRTLSAKTVRDLAQVTADLPGAAYRGPAPGPGLPHYDMDGWQEAMRAHRRQMQSMRQAHHEQWHRARKEMRRGRRGHHRPAPIVPILVALGLVWLVVGGFGIFKLLITIAIVALVFKLAHRAFHSRN